jgi:hypothetical protein
MLHAINLLSMSQTGNEKEKQGNTSERIVRENLQSAVARFYDAVEPVRASRNLRRIFFGYLLQERDALPVDFELYINDLANLFELLDAFEDNY